LNEKVLSFNCFESFRIELDSTSFSHKFNLKRIKATALLIGNFNNKKYLILIKSKRI